MYKSDFCEKNYKYFVAFFSALLFVILVLHIFIYSDANLNHYTARMDSDVASDTLLGPVIYKNSFHQPKSWYASSEICVISAPNLAAFIYPLVGYNTNLSMAIACIIMFIGLVVLMLEYFRQINFSFPEALIAIILTLSLTTPTDESQRMLFLYAAYYVSHFITLFIVMMFYNLSLKRNKVSAKIVIFTVILAFLNGLQGMHACLFCYVPLLGIEILRSIIYRIKNKKQINKCILIWILAITAIAYAATKLTGSYTLTPSRNIRHAGEKFSEIVWPFIKTTLSFYRFPAFVAAFLILAIIGYGVTMKRIVKKSGGGK